MKTLLKQVQKSLKVIKGSKEPCDKVYIVNEIKVYFTSIIDMEPFWDFDPKIYSKLGIVDVLGVTIKLLNDKWSSEAVVRYFNEMITVYNRRFRFVSKNCIWRTFISAINANYMYNDCVSQWRTTFYELFCQQNEESIKLLEVLHEEVSMSNNSCAFFWCDVITSEILPLFVFYRLDNNHPFQSQSKKMINGLAICIFKLIMLTKDGDVLLSKKNNMIHGILALISAIFYDKTFDSDKYLNHIINKLFPLSIQVPQDFISNEFIETPLYHMKHSYYPYDRQSIIDLFTVIKSTKEEGIGVLFHILSKSIEISDERIDVIKSVIRFHSFFDILQQFDMTENDFNFVAGTLFSFGNSIHKNVLSRILLELIYKSRIVPNSCYNLIPQYPGMSFIIVRFLLHVTLIMSKHIYGVPIHVLPKLENEGDFFDYFETANIVFPVKKETSISPYYCSFLGTKNWTTSETIQFITKMLHIIPIRKDTSVFINYCSYVLSLPHGKPFYDFGSYLVKSASFLLSDIHNEFHFVDLVSKLFVSCTLLSQSEKSTWLLYFIKNLWNPINSSTCVNALTSLTNNPSFSPYSQQSLRALTLYYMKSNNLPRSPEMLRVLQSYLSLLCTHGKVDFDNEIHNHMVNKFGESYDSCLTFEFILVTINCEFPTLMSPEEWFELLVEITLDIKNGPNTQFNHFIERFHKDIISSLPSSDPSSYRILSALSFFKDQLDSNEMLHRIIIQLFSIRVLPSISLESLNQVLVLIQDIVVKSRSFLLEYCEFIKQIEKTMDNMVKKALIELTNMIIFLSFGTIDPQGSLLQNGVINLQTEDSYHALSENGSSFVLLSQHSTGLSELIIEPVVHEKSIYIQSATSSEEDLYAEIDSIEKGIEENLINSQKVNFPNNKAWEPPKKSYIINNHVTSNIEKQESTIVNYSSSFMSMMNIMSPERFSFTFEHPPRCETNKLFVTYSISISCIGTQYAESFLSVLGKRTNNLIEYEEYRFKLVYTIIPHGQPDIPSDLLIVWNETTETFQYQNEKTVLLISPVQYPTVFVKSNLPGFKPRMMSAKTLSMIMFYFQKDQTTLRIEKISNT